MTTTAAKAPAKKTTTARKPAPVKGTPPRGAAKPPKRPANGTGAKGGQLGQSTTRHGKVADPVWETAAEKASGEGRGIWEVIRQFLAEYGRGEHDGCTPRA